MALVALPSLAMWMVQQADCGLRIWPRAEAEEENEGWSTSHVMWSASRQGVFMYIGHGIEVWDRMGAWMGWTGWVG